MSPRNLSNYNYLLIIITYNNKNLCLSNTEHLLIHWALYLSLKNFILYVLFLRVSDYTLLFIYFSNNMEKLTININDGLAQWHGTWLACARLCIQISVLCDDDEHNEDDDGGDDEATVWEKTTAIYWHFLQVPVSSLTCGHYVVINVIIFKPVFLQALIEPWGTVRIGGEHIICEAI